LPDVRSQRRGGGRVEEKKLKASQEEEEFKKLLHFVHQIKRYFLRSWEEKRMLGHGKGTVDHPALHDRKKGNIKVVADIHLKWTPRNIDGERGGKVKGGRMPRKE